MKIYLKQNWSEQFIYGDKTPGFFVGREQEIKLLKNIILGNASSAVLIASVRGIGKTSFVHKTLSEIKNIHPVFVNIGHALANTDSIENGQTTKNKKLVLISLIRAIHFNEDFKGDKTLEDLYDRCFGLYKEERSESKETNSTKNVGFKAELNINGRTIIQFLSILLLSLSFYLSEFIWRALIGFLGITFFFLSFKWEKSWLHNVTGKKSLVIDNSTEYLEIEFETWLKSKIDKKIVFVIDELDKIEEEKSLKAIKEYKNLFNLSFAHFLFLSSQKAFELVIADREEDAEKGGIFPTLFTHIIYLSLPKSAELKNYLSQIFNSPNKIDRNEEEELMDYLLFRSGNDFFELKRLISDIVTFNDKAKPLIDTDKIKEGDVHFSKVSELFEYTNEWFLKRNIKELKKYWKDNSKLQKEILHFLNEYFNINFNQTNIANSDNLKKLASFLISIGIIESEEIDNADNPESKTTSYKWTGEYTRGVKAPLLKEDEKFNKSFKSLIKLANDLNDLPDNYRAGKFEDCDSVLENKDGQNLSGINLYSFFSDYKDIFEKLQKDSQRISVTVEKINEATKIIDEQINNVSEKYFDISINLLNELFKDKPNFFINENIDSVNHNINGIFGSLPDFLSIAIPQTYQSRVYGRTDQTKYVLIIRYFEDEDRIGNALEVLKNNTNILVINLMYEDVHQVSYSKVYTDKLGRKRKKAMEVKNFINFRFNDFRQLSEILIKIEKHLGVANE